MFSTLSKGNVLYGLDKTDKIKWFTASVENVTPTIGNQNPSMFGQMPELRLDIVCNINGEQKTFQQVPSNSAIAYLTCGFSSINAILFIIILKV